jgi:hypothetical protein
VEEAVDEVKMDEAKNLLHELELNRLQLAKLTERVSTNFEGDSVPVDSPSTPAKPEWVGVGSDENGEIYTVGTDENGCPAEPESLCCPITTVMFRDPVFIAGGHRAFAVGHLGLPALGLPAMMLHDLPRPHVDLKHWSFLPGLVVQSLLQASSRVV